MALLRQEVEEKGLLRVTLPTKECLNRVSSIMVDVWVQSCSESLSFFLNAFHFLVTSLRSLCKLSCLDSDEPVNSFDLLDTSIKPSSIGCFLLYLLCALVQDRLMYWD